jgi:hypothetical protein
MWMLFGVLIFLALMQGFFWSGTSTPVDALILPRFGIILFGPFHTTDLVISWIHVMGFLLGSGLSIALGLAICVYVAPAWQRPACKSLI